MEGLFWPTLSWVTGRGAKVLLPRSSRILESFLASRTRFHLFARFLVLYISGSLPRARLTAALGQDTQRNIGRKMQLSKVVSAFL